jgi:hypothetical protein
MALFDGVSSLEDVLGQQADTAGMDISNQFAKKRRQTIAQQAAGGRLGSGVANYSLADVDSGEIGALGDVYGGLAEALGQVPAEDYFSMQDFERKRQLARRIAELQKPSGLEESFGALGSAANIAGKFAAFA